MIAFAPPIAALEAARADSGRLVPRGDRAVDARRRQLCVANIKGLQREPATITKGDRSGQDGLQFADRYHGSLSLVPLPAAGELAAASRRPCGTISAARQIDEALQPPRPGQPPRAMPERIGEPSLIRHVVYIIKENRTYDQVLGDVRARQRRSRSCASSAGGSRPTSTSWSATSRSGQHLLRRDPQRRRAQWCTTAFATDYLEKSFANFPRSYPDGMGEENPTPWPSRRPASFGTRAWPRA